MVLGLVARRLAGSRIGFLAVSRSGREGFFERGGLPGHEIGPLDEAAAAGLIAAGFRSWPQGPARGCWLRRRGIRWPCSSCPRR